MMQQAIVRELASCNGGPGLTEGELAERLGIAVALIRQGLAALVFDEATVTCDVEIDERMRKGPGRYRLGNPSALRRVK